MSDDPQQERTATILSVIVGAAMVGFAMWVVMGSGLFSSAPEPKVKTTLELVAAPADEALGEARAQPASPASSIGSEARDDDPLMAEIIGLFKSKTAVPNEALLTFKDKASLAKFLRLAKGYGLEVVNTLDGLNAVRVRFAQPEQLKDYLAAAGKDRPSLEANHWMAVPALAKPDPNNQGGAAPSGTKFLEQVGAAGDRAGWGKGVSVAVLDTGIKSNPTFGEGQVSHVDLVNDGTAFHSHGTSVASLIGGQDERVPGVAPDVSLMDIRIADAKGYSVTSVLSQGIILAADRGAQVINISMGGYDDSQVLRDAVAYALNKGIVIVAAAGTEKYDQLAYPARINGVVSVGSVDANGNQAFFSNSGPGLMFMAPGVSLPVAWDTNMMALASGTSQSSAVVAAIYAYYLGKGYTSQQATNLMQSHSTVPQGAQNQYGFGLAHIWY